MSRIVTTKLGRFRGVTDGTKKWWLWECPRCKTWANLSEKQWNGEVSVYCESPVRSHYYDPPETAYEDLTLLPCGYHETHEFAKELVVAMQVKILFGEQPFEEEPEHP